MDPVEKASASSSDGPPQLYSDSDFFRDLVIRLIIHQRWQAAFRAYYVRHLQLRPSQFTVENFLSRDRRWGWVVARVLKKKEAEEEIHRVIVKANLITSKRGEGPSDDREQ